MGQLLPPAAQIPILKLLVAQVRSNVPQETHLGKERRLLVKRVPHQRGVTGESEYHNKVTLIFFFVTQKCGQGANVESGGIHCTHASGSGTNHGVEKITDIWCELTQAHAILTDQPSSGALHDLLKHYLQVESIYPRVVSLVDAT